MSVLPIGISGPMSRKMFPQSAAPVNTNYVDLAVGSEYVRENERVPYYRKRGVGKNVPFPGAAGMGSGISHYVYRVPKSELLTRNEVRKIEKNEYNAMMALQAEERAAAAVVRKGEMNANVAGIVYTDEPMSAIDIDLPINLIFLADKALRLAAKKKWNSMTERNRGIISGTTTSSDGKRKVWYSGSSGRKSINIRPGFSAEEEIMIKENKVNVDDSIEALRNKFIDVEKEKVRFASHLAAEKKAPRNSYGKIQQEYAGSVPKEAARLVQEHIDRKMPKIEAVLAKLREGMILGFAPPAPKVAPKEENLLRFNNLSSINFSAPTGPAVANRLVDPFEGLNSSPKTRRARKSRKTRKLRR
jgi:hypothetical protein